MFDFQINSQINKEDVCVFIVFNKWFTKCSIEQLKYSADTIWCRGWLTLDGFLKLNGGVNFFLLTFCTLSSIFLFKFCVLGSFRGILK